MNVNVFYLDPDPVAAARALCDAHVRKMALESAQILSRAWGRTRDPARPNETGAEWAAARGLSGVGPYRVYRRTCPLAAWAESSREAYDWLLVHGFEIAVEFRRRYRPSGGPDHASLSVLRWLSTSADRLGLPDEPMRPPPLVMPERFREPDPVAAYRTYYREDKAAIATWSPPSSPPAWW